MTYEPFIPWDEVKSRLKCKPEVWERIRRLNPDYRGLKAYSWPRGYRRTSRSINMDVIGPKTFIAMFGREAYRAIPGNRIHRYGHRKLISREYIMDAGLR